VSQIGGAHDAVQKDFRRARCAGTSFVQGLHEAGANTGGQRRQRV
jgi:hypothetical protein